MRGYSREYGRRPSRRRRGLVRVFVEDAPQGGPIMRARVLVLTLITAAAASASPADFTLVQDGQPQAVVRLGDAPTDVEVLARDELVRYIEMSTGATLPVEGQMPGRVELVVSGTKGFRIGTDVTRMRARITGSTPVALLVGTYRFLQDHLGCRWFCPGEIGEVVPEAETVTVPVGTSATSPDWGVRTFFLRDGEGYWWGLRNGLNGWFSQEWVKSLGTGTGSDLLYQQPEVRGFHAWARIMPPEVYRDEHPEYYALVNGRRVAGGLHSGQICTTNEEVLELISAKARDYFEADPGARYYSVAPNDGYDWCTCDSCMALEEQLGGVRYWQGGDRMVTSSRQVYFGNEIADRALEGLPDRELIIFAYVSHAPPPIGTHPHEGVTVWLCHYLPACYAHSWMDEDCPDNAEFRRYVEGWAQWADRMGYYAYTDKSMWKGLPRPVVRPMMRDLKGLYDFGWRRYVAQSSARGFGQNGPLYWVTAKMLWDVEADVDALLADYFPRAYGPAAEEMARYMATLETAMLEPTVHFTTNPYGAGPEVFGRAEIAAAREHLELARDQAATEGQRARVQKRLDSLRRAEGKLTYGWARQEYIDTGNEAALQEAIAAVKALAGSDARAAQRFGQELLGLEWLEKRGLYLDGIGAATELGGRTAYNTDETGQGDGKAGWVGVEVPRADHSRPHLLTVETWGTSANFGPVICTEGGGKGTAAGGVWTKLERVAGELSGEEQWHTLVFRAEPEQFDPEVEGAKLGFGGGDSQIWIS
ncbi:MAG: DUF4838 domain-containing protein, partial [Armatimonadia bacterium]|nr:DUF4838 domain-containing protein [Armatimonadia bacterium]